jgi:TonB family protein
MTRKSLLLALVLQLFALTHRADAQTTSVKIIAPEGGAAPVAAKPLDILVTEYPLLSLLSDEQGTTNLDLSLDSNGKPNAVQVSMSSGYPALDQQAVQIARSRWAFQAGIASSVKVAIDWTVPASVVNDYDIDMPARPKGVRLPAFEIDPSHKIGADDYPALAIRTREQGIVAVRYFVKEDSALGEIQIVQSSGKPRLDDAAIKMVKKWKFHPLIQDGKPISAWQALTVTFLIFPDAFEKKNLSCYPRPVLAPEGATVMVQITAPKDWRVVERWTFVTGTGEQKDMLFGTKAGLMRPSNSLKEIMKGTGYLKSRDASGCWYYDPIFLPR